MPASEDISFELARFEWARPDRLEVEGRWHGVRRRLARATLVVEVDGKRRRLRALAGVEPASPERWVAAFPWEGELPKLPGAELEVGRGIVVDLPRPRRSKARGAASTPAEPIPATTGDEREATPGREEAERLLAVLTAARSDAEEAGARAAAADAKATALRERAEAAEAKLAELELAQDRAETAETELEAVRARTEAVEAELETERGRADTAEAELEAVRERAETEFEAVRKRADAAETKLVALRGRSEEVESERTALEARVEAAEAEVAGLRGGGDDAALERLRTELQTVERERIELRAQLDETLERLEAAEQEARTPARRSSPAPAANTSERTRAMPGPRTVAAGGARFGRGAEEDTDAEGTDPRRRARRPAERTARRSGAAPEPSAADSSGPALAERISEWVASLTGSRPESRNGGAEREPAATPTRPGQRAERIRAAQASGAAVGTRRRADRRSPREHDGPSWPLRVAAIALLGLLMVALVVILLSLL